MAIPPPGPPNSNIPVDPSAKTPLSKEEKRTRLQTVSEGKIPKASHIVPATEPVATPILAPKQSTAPAPTELKEKTVTVDKDVKKQRRLSGLFSSSLKKETGEPSAGKNEKESAKYSKNPNENKSRPPTESKSKAPIETNPKLISSAEHLQGKIQQLVDYMKINETVVEFQETKSKEFQAKKTGDKVREKNLSEKLSNSKNDYEGALASLKNFLTKNNFKNFEEAEKVLINEIRDNLIEMLHNPKTQTSALSTLSTFNTASPQFVKMILSLEPRDLKLIIVSLAKDELDPKNEKTHRPFRSDNLFTKLFREKVLSELNTTLKPLVVSFLKNCVLEPTQSPPESARKFLFELNQALKQSPPSPELTKILNEIRELIQASPTYSNQSGIFLMNLFLLRGANFLINNPESLGINFTDAQRSAAGKATGVLMNIANIEKAETEDSRLLLELVPLLTGQESKANTNNKP